MKRDFSRGHQLDERHEEDKIRIVANERRMLMLVGRFLIAMREAMIVRFSYSFPWASLDRLMY